MRLRIPDPFALTLGLVAVVVVVGWASGPLSLAEVLKHFVAGMFVPAQLSFAFQMALVLMSGMAIASAPPVKRALHGLATLPSSSSQAALMIALVSMGSALLNWGISLVVGAIIARATAQTMRGQGKPVPYAVFGAAAYSGLAVWHGGLSGSAPLTAAKTSSTFGEAISVSLTTFSASNLLISGALVLALSITCWRLGRRGDDADENAVAAMADDDAIVRGSVAGSVGSSVAAVVVAVGIAVVVVSAFVDKGGAAVTLDWFIAACVALGVALHARNGVLSWGRALQASAVEVGGIMLHFPFYFGVIAVATDAGLVARVAAASADVTAWLAPAGSSMTTTVAALSTWLSAAFINLLIPSGGGQWAVQAPFIAKNAQALGIERAPLVMAFAYGDQLTNLLQPFWALPVLSITGLRASALLPITARLMLVAAVVVAVGLVVFSI